MQAPNGGLPVIDICDTEIEIPEQAPLQIRHLNDATLPLLLQQTQALAAANAHREALLATCEQFKQQVTALKAKLAKRAEES